jgi:DNA (cytosine-5)-methyltransferase 1
VSDQYAHEGKLIAMAHGQGGAEIAEGYVPTLTCVHEAPIAAYALQGAGHTSQNSQGSGWNEEVSFTLNCMDVHGVAQPVGTDVYNGNLTGDIAATMGTPGSSINASGPTVMVNMAVRRLTPTECERLQGFPDGYTNIPWRKADDSPDGPRYKALGNSWAVPVVRWIGSRIQESLK